MRQTPGSSTKAPPAPTEGHVLNRQSLDTAGYAPPVSRAAFGHLTAAMLIAGYPPGDPTTCSGTLPVPTTGLGYASSSVAAQPDGRLVS